MVHPSLEPYVNAVRAQPATHPSLLSAEERRAAYREIVAGGPRRARGAGLDSRSGAGTRAAHTAALGSTCRSTTRARRWSCTSTAAASWSATSTPTTPSVADSAPTPGCVSLGRLPAGPGTPVPGRHQRRRGHHSITCTRTSSEFDEPGVELIVMGDSAGATLMTVACA